MKITGAKFRKSLISLIYCGLLSLQILATCAFGQTNYYVSSAGSDSSNGTSTSTPWRTISKVNSVTFTSGSSIYFRCEDTFYGQININQSNITLRSYGFGNKPVINGAVQLTGWTVYSGSIYVSQASSFVKNLYANGEQMTLARYPNTGFMLIDSKTNSTTFTSSEITQASGYWNGANCRLRTNGWTFESPTVSTQNGTTIVLTSAPYFNEFKTNWGFYLDNRLAALDVEREWYCDPSNNKVYFYAPDGVDPNTLSVYGSTLDYGVNSSSSYITVRDLEFDYQCKAGLNFTGRNITLLSNTVYGGWMNGIDLRGTNCTVDGNIVQNVNGNGIHLYYSAKDGIVTNNTIKSIGTVKGYQSPATAYGILSEGTYAIIRNNYIDSIGYDGIYAFSYDLVERNIVKNTMLILADGGAIYTGSGSSYVTIQNNVITGVTGSNEGAPLWGGTYESWTCANGIYLDGGSSNCVVKDNTIVRAGSIALMVNYSTHDHTISNNTAYDCASNAGGYFLHIGMDVALNDGGHNITKNIFYPSTSVQKLIEIQDFSSTFHSPGVIDSNYYLNPHGNTVPFETLLNKSGGWSRAPYSFAEWKAVTDQDTHSNYIIPESYKRDTVFINSTASPVTVNLPSVLFNDLDNNSIVGSFILAPYSSKVLIQDTIQIISTITVSPSSLLFNDVIINTSNERTYTLSGSNLIPSSGNIKVTASSTAFQVSLTSGSGFSSSLNVPYTGGTLSAITIYVRFSPVTVQSYSGDITNEGGGAAIKNVAVTGTGIPAPIPTLNVIPDALAFSTVIIDTISSERTYTIQGTNLSPAVDTLTITAPDGYSISTATGSGFASSKRIAYTNGTIPATTIYVIFSPTAVEEYTGNITNTAGEITKDVAVTGTGVSATSAAITVNPTSLSFGDVIINTASNEKTYALTGINLTPASDTITITATDGFTISTTSGSGFASIKKIAYTGGTIQPIPKIIYVRFNPTSLKNYTGNITNTGGEAAVQTVSVSGMGITVPTPLLTAEPKTLSFDDIPINTTSEEQIYTLTGIDLTPANGNNTITVPEGFEVSITTGESFSTSLTLGYIGGILSEIPIYVRFAPTAVQDYTGSIVNTGGGAEADSVYVSGRGTYTTDVEDANGLNTIKLSQNYPNPFNPKTVISYKLTVKSEVVLRIYDILGKEIITLVNEVKKAGYHTVEWDGKNSKGQQVSSGMYFYQLKAGNGFVSTKKMLMLK